MTPDWPRRPAMLPKAPYTAPLGATGEKVRPLWNERLKLLIYQLRPQRRQCHTDYTLSKTSTSQLIRRCSHVAPCYSAGESSCGVMLGVPGCEIPWGLVLFSRLRWFLRGSVSIFPRVCLWWFRCVRLSRVRCWFSRWFRFRVSPSRVWRFVGGFVIFLCVSR